MWWDLKSNFFSVPAQCVERGWIVMMLRCWNNWILQGGCVAGMCLSGDHYRETLSNTGIVWRMVMDKCGMWLEEMMLVAW